MRASATISEKTVKIAVTIVRTLMGLLLLFVSISYLFNLMPQPELTGRVKKCMDGLIATSYFMPLLKVTELVCGLAFVSGRYVALATVVIAPIVVNIFMFHLLLLLNLQCLSWSTALYDKLRP